VPDRPNPFGGVTDFFSELARMRSVGVRGGGEHGVEAVERTHASAWVPPTDILALGDDLVVRVELAGVDPEDIDLRFSHGVLTVSGSVMTRRNSP
jgi:HSP20 family protein